MKLGVVLYFLLGLVALTANAKELFPESVFPKNSTVEVGDTLAKYPIHVDGPGWTYTDIRVGSSTGGTASLQMPTVFRAKRVNGVVAFGAATTVTVGQALSGGWNGDPCGGDTIFKINRVRGNLDRCAVMRFTEIPIAGIKKTVLQAEAIETNNDGRYYRHMIFAVLDNLGLSTNFFLKGTPFEPQAMAWLEQFLNATIKAAEYNPSLSAYAAVPSFQELVSSKRPSVKHETKSDAKLNDTKMQVNGFEEANLEASRKKQKDLEDQLAASQSKQMSLESSPQKLTGTTTNSNSGVNDANPSSSSKAGLERLTIDLQPAQMKCIELGFKIKTEAYGKCVLQLSK
jgi:hypothetical protein